ncbi:hypothetical protein AC578_2656 [Pseudocercospora eumusae]|uniref:Zn(2)-C6 fungal-type domain-containing protein n=1 Tax=Pseudocercospora eumusae TaxID=321146 RepID=A0A139H124_9PEZI|nr:hypothetical protein AC578_2656 [Pseudocercospora eumusae]
MRQECNKGAKMSTPTSTKDKRRRDKPTLSCTFCRARKLRCDRQSPCGACVRRDKPSDCYYTSTEQERRDAVDYRPAHARGPQNRQRVARLEKMVTEMRDMMQHSVNNPKPEPAQTPANHPQIPQAPLGPVDFHASEAPNMGSLSLDDSNPIYVGNTHWSTILDDLQQLKDDLPDELSNSSGSPVPSQSDTGTQQEPAAARISLLNTGPCLPRDQILAMLPPRKVVDRLISQFFNSFDLASFILSRSNFLSEYSNFWNNPAAAPIMWVGLLFSMMTMSALLQQQQEGRANSSTPDLSPDMLETYRTLTIHCLVAGDYLNPTRYTIETLMIHFAVDQNINIDIWIGNYLLLGVIIRIAFRIGLHRDPRHWPNLRPLQAEMRRRIWTSLYHMDFFTSTQVGLPRLIKDSLCDTRPPAHLFENDLTFQHDQVPPERPWTSHTPLLGLIQRDGIIKVASEIYDATEAAHTSPSAMIALDAKLQRTIAAMPTWLRHRPLELCVGENPGAILNRMFLDILIQKATYLLHRRSFVQGTTGQESPKSNELCINAALAILEHQRRLSEEIEPGGLWFSMRWKVATSLNHEFLQATMMLCFALSRLDDGNQNPGALHRREDISQALSTAKGLFEKNAHRSQEARRAAKAIATVLKQDLDKMTPPSMSTSDAFFEQMPGISDLDYIGNFDYGQNMLLDPTFLDLDVNGNLFDGVGIEHIG